LQISPLDLGVLAFYFLFLASIGWITRRFIHNPSDYFRGGGQMLWWMAGASAFMNFFSAWSFTGAASRAYTDGLNILWIYIGNAAGFFLCACYIAPRLRQLRVITPMEAIRQRFGVANEQVFTWLSLPSSVVYAGIWLNGLAVFLHGLFGFDLQTTILVTGLIVVFNSTLGGSWAVVSGDFMQTLILMMIAIATAIGSLVAIGGPVELVTRYPAESWMLGSGVNYPLLALAWVVMMVFKQMIATNSVGEANKYLYAKDGRHASRAALMAGGLMLVGPILWFIPPMVARIQYPDLTTVFPEMGARASEGAYVVVAMNTLPNGMIGLLIAGMFAATISSMDSGLNRNAGIFIRNFYLPVLRPQASGNEQVFVGKMVTLVFGAIVIGVSLLFSQLKNLGLFDLMNQFSALVGIPFTIPLILMIFVKRTPDWSAWSTVLLGLVLSYIGYTHFNGRFWDETFSLGMSLREINDWDAMQGVIIGVTILPAWFLFTRRFYKEPEAVRKTEIQTYWKNLHTPIQPEEMGDNLDGRQGAVLGGLAAVYGTFVLLLALAPNPLSGRLVFVGFAAVLIGLGAVLYRSYNRRT
jgi:SSS family transporter